VWAPGSATAEVSYQVSGSLGLKLGLQVGLNDGCSGQWRIQGGGDGASGLSVNFEYFCTGFVSFVSLLNCKIRVQRLIVSLKNCVKMYPNLSILETTNDFFSAEGPTLSTTPHPSTPTAPRPLLTEILNTSLVLRVSRYCPQSSLWRSPRHASRPGEGKRE